MIRVLKSPSRFIVAWAFLCLFCAKAVHAAPLVSSGFAEGDDKRLLVEVVAEGFGIPWGLVLLSSDEVLLSEREGKLWRVNLLSGVRKAVTGLPAIAAAGQGGLLDVAVHPQSSDWVYFTYSKPVADGATTALACAQLDGQQLRGWQDLLVADAAGGGRHFGSRIAFDGRGHVFFSVGDRGERESAQDLSNHKGSILRLNLDGSVPADNPFVGVKGARDEIWSYGHRNPQGLVFDRNSKRLWAIEHGPRGGDELNLIERGGNYGWPVLSYGKEYMWPQMVGEGTHREGMVDPAKVYIPSIAPSSLWLYQGQAFPQWQGDLFAGALKLRHLNQIKLDETGTIGVETRWLLNREARIRAISEDSQGQLLLTTDSGQLLRVSLRR